MTILGKTVGKIRIIAQVRKACPIYSTEFRPSVIDMIPIHEIIKVNRLNRFSLIDQPEGVNIKIGNASHQRNESRHRIIRFNEITIMIIQKKDAPVVTIRI